MINLTDRGAEFIPDISSAVNPNPDSYTIIESESVITFAEDPNAKFQLMFDTQEQICEGTASPIEPGKYHDRGNIYASGNEILTSVNEKLRNSTENTEVISKRKGGLTLKLSGRLLLFLLFHLGIFSAKIITVNRMAKLMVYLTKMALAV